MHIYVLYMVSGDFLSMFRDVIPRVISSQKCHMNMGSIVNGYEATDIWHLRFLLIATSKIRRSSSLLYSLRSHVLMEI